MTDKITAALLVAREALENSSDLVFIDLSKAHLKREALSLIDEALGAPAALKASTGVAQILETLAYEAPISGNHIAQARVLMAAKMYAAQEAVLKEKPDALGLLHDQVHTDLGPPAPLNAAPSLLEVLEELETADSEDCMKSKEGIGVSYRRLLQKALAIARKTPKMLSEEEIRKIAFDTRYQGVVDTCRALEAAILAQQVSAKDK